MSDLLGTMSAFWSAQATALLDAQKQAARAVSDGLGAALAGKAEAADTGGMAQAGAALGTLWEAANRMSAELAERILRAPGDSGPAGAVERMLDPRRVLSGATGFDQLLTKVADAPPLADLFAMERRSAQALRAWGELRRHAAEQQRIVLEAWLEAGTRYLEEVGGKTGAGGRPLEPKAAFRLWTEVVNQRLVELQRSEQYLQNQRELVRASTDVRLLQAEAGEALGKQWGMPTRSEMDDVHRALTELRREVRRLVRATKPPPEKAAAEPPKRRRAPRP